MKPARNSVTIDRFTSDPSTTIVKQAARGCPLPTRRLTMLTDSGPE
jgi:hypothetical protein